MSPLRVVLAPFGSEGDVNPLLWAGRVLAARGHEPVVLLTPNYGPLAEAAGLAWEPVGGPGDFEAMARDPRFWRPFTGPAHVARAMLRTFPAWEEAWGRLPWRPDLAVVSTFAFSAAFAAEARGIPRITAHMQPSVLFSAQDPPVLAPGFRWVRRLPRAMGAVLTRGLREAFGAALMRPLNRRRAALGLCGWRDFEADVIFGGERVALFFPAVFAPGENLLPGHARMLGFPLPEERPPLDPALARWIGEHGPPVVWTHGSANFDTARFARCALATADLHPCVLVTVEPPPLPLPPRALHVRRAPFETLFPLSRAVVHHGGIGTAAKALDSRVPQLVIARALDQPDNAARIARMGAGHAMSYLGLTPGSARRALRRLLADFPGWAPEFPGLRAGPEDFAGWAGETVSGPRVREHGGQDVKGAGGQRDGSSTARG